MEKYKAGSEIGSFRENDGTIDQNKKSQGETDIKQEK